MKKLLLLCIIALGFTGYSQDVYFQESNPQAKETAIKITDQYNKQLALSAKQQLLFQQKVEEFLITRYRIESEFSGREKLNLLLSLQEKETEKMHNILTRLQLEIYKNIKPDIQPLEVVQKE